MQKQLTAIIEREGDGCVSLCPAVNFASQGATIEKARDNLRAALELFFETASPNERQPIEFFKSKQRYADGTSTPGSMAEIEAFFRSFNVDTNSSKFDRDDANAC